MYITENRVAGYDALLPQISPYFEGFSAAVVDIETTGLSAARDAVFLIGVLTRAESHPVPGGLPGRGAGDPGGIF